MGRAPCCDKNGLKKGPWTPEEDQKLLDYIQKHGHGRWRTLPKNAGLSRCGKSCRLRWTNYLRPDIKRGRFTFEEEEAIIQLHCLLGNKWSAIAARLPGRTDNEIKNYWNTHIRKRLLRMGIDPVTHTPRLDLLDLSSLLNTSLYGTPQLEVSRLLGIEPVVNTELLRIATSLLSAQRQNNDHRHQNSLQELQQQQQQQQLVHSKVHEQFQPSFSHEQLANPVQQIPVCSNSSSVPLFDGAQLMQANEGLFHPGEDSANSCQNNNLPCSLPESFSIHQNSEVYRGVQTGASGFSQLLSEAAPDFDFGNGQAFNLISVLSRTATSPTPLNSSSTYINSTTTEDERDSYCSSVLNYQMPDLMDVPVFM